MRRLSVALVATTTLLSCAPDDSSFPTVTMSRSALLSELGPFHLRVFPKTATLRCDVALGQVLVNGRRDLAMLPGKNVQPAERCGAAWSTLSPMYGTASPVDSCMERQTSVSVPSGTYVVLVHGQGTFRRPTGETRSGIRGSGCVEVTLGAGATRDVTLAMVEQVDDRARCGDSMLDSNETCDLGAANGMADSGCSAMCQTVERAVNNQTDPRLAAGNQRNPAVSWAPGAPLAVAFDVTDNTEEDVRARYFSPDGADLTEPAALVRDVVAGGGPDQQLHPALAPAASLRGFVAAWETITDRNVLAQTFDDQAPRATTPPRYVSVPVAMTGAVRQQPAVAASASRALVAWREGTGATGALRVSSYALALPLTAPSAAVMLAANVSDAPRAVAAPDGTFVVAWSSAGDIFAQRVSAMGAAMGAAVSASPVSAQVQDQPALAALADGTFVVAWRDAAQDAVDSDGTSVRWVRLSASLQRMGDARTAPTTVAGNQARPTVAAGAGTNPPVLIAWEDATTGHIRGRLVRADGAEVFSRVGGSTRDFAISAGAGSARRNPAAAAGGASVPQFAVAWEGDDGMGTGVRMRLFPQ
jgi:hypothetical protein